MTRFSVEMLLVCPSDWNAQKLREYLHRIAITPEEQASVRIRESDSPSSAPVYASDVGKSGVQPHGLSLEAVRELVDRIESDAEQIATLKAAIREYRRWFDTCTRTGSVNWEELAALASEGLDAALDESSIQSRVLSDQPTKGAQGKQESGVR